MGGLRRWRRGLTAALAGVLLAACGGSAGGQSAGGTPTLNWYIFHDVSGSFPADAAACSAASGGEYTIQIRELPAAADGQREQLVRRSAAKDSSLDILGLDVVWEAEFAEAGWIQPWTGERRRQVTQDAVKAALDTATWKGQLVAAPFNSNTQLLWYRKDLVPHPPTTWAEMISQAEALARQGKPHHIEIQGASYEGYTVWVNAMVLSAGGRILSADGQQVVLGPPAQRGVDLIGQLARSSAADPSLSVQMEDQNRLAFETGKAAFEINYPFVYPSAVENAPDLAKQMAWTEYPRVDADRPSRPPVGGIDLAVSAHSQHKEQAFDAIACLRNRPNQLRNAVKGGLPPTLASLYKDPKLIKGGYPFAAEIFNSLQRGGIRPKTPAYQSVSIAMSNTLHPPASAPAKFNQLRGQLQDAVESKGLIP
ncbi:MAG TPA: extracellular solute-binding protein [Actinomycetota bacterium]|nr:extracellular solute-binding protein [Actinomycetota bacterium]